MVFLDESGFNMMEKKLIAWGPKGKTDFLKRNS